MRVRLKLTLTILATGIVTALLVMATVLYAFERFERETLYHRASGFLARVVAQYDNILDLHERYPADFGAWMSNLMLFEPDSELYLLAPDGRVLATTAKVSLPPDFRVAMAPVRQSAGRGGSPYVMGDDPERMDAGAVVAAVPLQRAVIRSTEAAAGYLYLVCHPGGAAASRWAALRSSFGMPLLALIAAIVALTTATAAWVTASITRPLARLAGAIARVSREGLESGVEPAVLPPAGGDEFGQLASVLRQMLETLRSQWSALRRLDHFRREAVSNLSHDLRSPLTATVACLETLDARLAAGGAESTAEADPGGGHRALIEVALRNSRNAARLVQSLGDLAQLDEPAFGLQPVAVDAAELLDDIVLRFGERARARQMRLTVRTGPAAQGWVDIELFERALANLLDNAIKHGRTGDRIEVAAQTQNGRLQVTVADSGPGIPRAALPQLFERFYQSRAEASAVTAGDGKGLGLTIVKRIVELHGGEVAVQSALGQGTTITMTFPGAGRTNAVSGNP